MHYFIIDLMKQLNMLIKYNIYLYVYLCVAILCVMRDVSMKMFLINKK